VLLSAKNIPKPFKKSAKYNRKIQAFKNNPLFKFESERLSEIHTAPLKKISGAELTEIL